VKISNFNSIKYSKLQAEQVVDNLMDMFNVQINKYLKK